MQDNPDIHTSTKLPPYSTWFCRVWTILPHPGNPALAQNPNQYALSLLHPCNILVQVESTISRPTIFHIYMWVLIHYHLQIIWDNFQVAFHPTLIYNPVCNLIYVWFWDHFAVTISTFAQVVSVFLAPIYGCGTPVSIIHADHFNRLSFVLLCICRSTIHHVSVLEFFPFKVWHLCCKVSVDKVN